MGELDDRKRAERAVALYHEEHALIAAARERAEIAGQLHDSAVQQVIAARHRLELARRVGTGQHAQEVETHLEAVDQQLAEALGAMRKVMTGISVLRLAFDNVRQAIDTAVTEVGEAFGISVDVRCSGRADETSSAAPLVYRITLEALRNVGKHAGTSHARIDAHVDGEIVVEVSDAGRGFDAPVDLCDPGSGGLASGFGLANSSDLARRCGGSLALRSVPARGTQVTLRLPVDPIDER